MLFALKGVVVKHVIADSIWLSEQCGYTIVVGSGLVVEAPTRRVDSDSILDQGRADYD